MAEKTADVVKVLMKMGVMANATQSLESDTAQLVAEELGHKVNVVKDDDVLNELKILKIKKIVLKELSSNNYGSC